MNIPRGGSAVRRSVIAPMLWAALVAALPRSAYALCPPGGRAPGASGPGVPRPPEVGPDTLRTLLDSLREALGIPGAAAAIATHEGVVWTGVAGLAAPSRPLEPGMLFETGSITKPFTAGLVLSLAAEGVLAPDDPLTRWVPDFPNARGITVRQLLQHTSGLHDYAENPDYLPALRADFTKVWKPEDSFAFMKEPYFEPGAGWHYSNANYQLLGMIVEKATGRPFAEVVRGRLLDRLSLEHTWFDASEEPTAPRAHAFIDIDGDGTPEDLTALVPNTSFITAAGAAGAIVATAEDVARYGQALWTGGVVSGELYREMTTWVDRGDGMEYGLGVIRDARGDRELWGHKGNTAGYSGAVWHDPEAEVTVAVLTNAHLRDVTPIATALLRRACTEAVPSVSCR